MNKLEEVAKLLVRSRVASLVRPGPLVAAASVVVLMLGVLLATSIPAQAGTGSVAFTGSVAYTGGDGVALRNAPSATAKISPLIVWGDGHAVPIICQAWSSDGSAVGPNSNRIFDKVYFAGYGGDTWVPDAYVSGTDAANQFTSGIPQCGSSSSGGGSASGALPAVWVGSPLVAAWPNAAGCSGATYPSSACSLPSVHHYSTSSNYADFAMDIQARPGENLAGQAVYLYAAPKNTAIAIQARVDAINSPCASHLIADGGYQVIIGLYANNGTQRIGYATYAHINPSVSVGQWVNRWGTKLGTVGSYRYSSCWQGVHLHFQMYSSKNYACYRGNLAPGAYISRTNFLGYIGGSFSGSPRRACP